jgi:hypothetical protein
MRIVFHIGANCTDGDRLLKSLMRSSNALTAARVAVPGPGKYRNLLGETLKSLDGRAPGADTRDVLLDAILDDQDADRLVMSNSTFLSMAPRIFEGGQFYGRAESRLTAFAACFAGDQIDLHLAVRNPATWLPAVFAQSSSRSFAAFMAGVNPLTLRWSDLIARIQRALPQAHLTVWCNEDTPLIWPALLRGLAGLPPSQALAGRHDMLAAIMQPDGFARFESYIATHPQPSELQERRVIGAFLDKFVRREEIEEEIDLPGWTDATVTAVTDAYEADVARIAALPGVNFIAP